MKKIVAMLLSVTLALGAFAGCSSKPASSAPGSTPAASAPTGEKVKLDVMWFSDGKEGETFRRLADQYEAEKGNVEIEIIEVPYDDMTDKIKNMLNAKKAPALARLSSAGVFENQLVNLYDYVEDKDAFKANFTNALKIDYNGKMIGAPMDVTPNGLMYNKTAFDKAGVKVPQSPEEVWTWEEWKEAMKTVMEKGGVKYGLVYDRSPQRFSTLLYQAGGQMLKDDLSGSAFNSPETARAVNFFKELHDEKIIADSVWLGSENPNNLFRTGQVAMHFSGNWVVSNYKDEIKDFEWGVTYLPKDKTRATVPGGKYIGAFQGSGVEKEAVEFIEWLSRPEINAQYCVENNFISPVVGNEKLDYAYGAEFFEIFSNELANTSEIPGREWGSQDIVNKYDTDMRGELIKVLAGKLTTDEYMKQMEERINKACAK